jgi:DNA primase catalytic subunit
MNAKQIFDYYSRQEVKDALLEVGKDREVVGVFKNGSFDKRPNTLASPGDIAAMVRSGVVEFHCSLERWSNPMGIASENYEKLRKGWDLILDVDCDSFELAKIATGVIAATLKRHGVENISIKFTGGTGFHLAVPWESFPEKVGMEKTSSLFPSLARKIILYLKQQMIEQLVKEFRTRYKISEIAEMVGKDANDIVSGMEINPFEIVDIDPVLISNRHLFRMPYSLNAKTFLVSLPIGLEKLGGFERELASPENIDFEGKFLESRKPNEMEPLIDKALFWYAQKEEEEKEVKRRIVRYEKKIPLEMMSPCIKHILSGLSDGRKRSVFILINLLSTLKWKPDEIEQLLFDWNKKNKPPLGGSYIRGQIRYARRRGSMPPPNCVNEGYYLNFKVCKPDNICSKIKNPATYPLRLLKRRKR